MMDDGQDHESYFPTLTKMCDEIKAANLGRWRKYGEGKCGLSEAVIRGAVIPGQEQAEVKEGEANSNTSTVVAGLERGEGEVEVEEIQKGVEEVSIGTKQEEGKVVEGVFDSGREEIKRRQGEELGLAKIEADQALANGNANAVIA